MGGLTLLELTGAASAPELAASWPHATIRPEREGDYDLDGAARLIEHLNKVLRFENVRSFATSAGAGAVAVTADIHVAIENDPAGPLGAVHRNLGDFVLRLGRMDSLMPAHLLWTRFADGTSEFMLFDLPVEVHMPMDMLATAGEAVEDNQGFQPTRPDSLGVRLETGLAPSVLRFFTRLRITRIGEVVLFPNVPISLGRCLFMGLPCRAVHDLAFLPNVTLAAGNVREVPVGWAQPKTDRPELVRWTGILADRRGPGGMVTVRTIDLDREAQSVKQVYDFLATNVTDEQRPLEIPIEDLALAFDPDGGQVAPAFPLHGLTGIRRAYNDDTFNAEAFDHRLAPVVLPVLNLVYIHLHRLMLGWTVDPVVSFDLAITDDTAEPEARAVTVSFTADYVLRVGYVPPAPKKLFMMGDATFSFLAVRAGINLGALYGPHAPRDPGLKDIAEALVDLALVSKAPDEPGGADKKGIVAFTARDGRKLDVVIRDIGLKAGKPSFTLWVPDGIDLNVLGQKGFHIDEIGLATTTHGDNYIRLSASYRIGAQAEPIAAPDSQTHPAGSGIWLRGLRVQAQKPSDDDHPWVALDGAVVSLRKKNSYEIEGGGWMRDEVVGGMRLSEFGFGIRVLLPLGFTHFILSGLLVKGCVKTGNDKVDYLLAGLTFGPIPFGSFTIIKASVLVARNYLPLLPAPTGVEQNLRMLKWYKAQPDGLELPPSRVMGAWAPSPDSWALGVALRLGLGNSGKVKLDGFGLWLKTPETWSLLVGLELRWADIPDPVGWLAVEYDEASGRWGATGGISIGVRQLTKSNKISDLAKFTGAVFISNSPRTIALGHIEDVDSWLQFKVQLERFELLFRVGFCYYNYDGDPPMNAIGFVLTGKGRGRVASQIELSFLLEASLRLGSFSSDGETSGLQLSIEAAFRVRVWRINFGLRGRFELEQIHPDPDAGRITLDFWIETPWFLPDVHVSHCWDWGDEADVAWARVASLPVAGGQAVAARGGKTIDLAAPLPAGADDAARPYAIAELDLLSAPELDDAAFAALTPIGVDSAIAIDFAPTMTDLLGTGETTPMAASLQVNGEIYCDYEVIALGVRRRPRFDGSAWTSLVDPQTTSTTAIDPISASVDELVASFASHLSMRWDRDHVRAGKLDARRLLLNSATPFTLAANPIADEALLDDVDATCCGRKSPRPWVKLDFESSPLGVRMPANTAFPGGAAHVRWHGLLPPVVVEDDGLRWARVPLTGRTGQALATLRFDEAVSRVAIRLAWPKPVGVIVRFEMYRGLVRVDTRDLALGNLLLQSLELQSGKGADRLVIRLLSGSGPLGALYIDTLAYVNREREIAWLLGLAHCHGGGTLPGGVFAWLPNHDYEITVTSRVKVGHDRLGALAAPVEQKVLFRTKGWPGLNAPESPGGDLAPFVESLYPAGPSQLLYRREPVMVVMSERFSPLAPVVDAPPDAPPERRQLLQWSLLIDQLGGLVPGAVATYPGADWLSANRTPPGPLGPSGARGDAVLSHVRHATSLDPRRLRFDTIRRSPANCQPKEPLLHGSRVYACPAPEGGWGHAAWRARIVQRGGPYALRDRFESADLGALTVAAQGGGQANWSVDETGALVAAGGAARAWAVFGDAGWLHLQIGVDVDPAGGTAGAAIAVAGEDGLVALIDAASGELRLERRAAGVDHPLDRAPLTIVPGPMRLELIGYDDFIVARVGEAELRAPRGAAREGRVALIGTPNAQFSRLAVEPVEAMVTEYVTSRWQGFAEHIAACRDGASLEIGAGRADITAWLASRWTEIEEAMASGADPRDRGALFRNAIETLGIPIIEQPAEPLITILRSQDASAALLLEGPEPIAFAQDAAVRLQRRRRRRPPFGDVRPPTGGSVLATRRIRDRGIAASERLRADLDRIDVVDHDLFPVDPIQWLDIPALVLTDDSEQRALILPIDVLTRSLATIPTGLVRAIFTLDRERYRSAVPDPDARYRAEATRHIDW